MKKHFTILFIVFFTIIISVLIVYDLFDNGILKFVEPDPDIYKVRGIDVSHHQHIIDWEEVKSSDIYFAFIKATEGDDFKDTMFDINWHNAIANNIIPGAYHFYSLRYPGISQANNFIDSVPNIHYMLPPVIDLEYGGNSILRPTKLEFIKELSSFISVIKEYYKKEPILYTTKDFYDDYLHPEFMNYKIWIRSIFTEPHKIGFTEWTFWQYNARGSIDGIDGFVDLNVFNGTHEEFNNLLFPVY